MTRLDEIRARMDAYEVAFAQLDETMNLAGDFHRARTALELNAADDMRYLLAQLEAAHEALKPFAAMWPDAERDNYSTATFRKESLKRAWVLLAETAKSKDIE